MSLFGQSSPAVSTSCYQGSSASTITLGPLDTTGANAIAVVVASFDRITSVTDNKSNGNATGLTAASGNSPNTQLFYWLNPNGGTAHTITVNGNNDGLYGSACVYVMSGVTGTYSGAQSAHFGGYANSTCQAGSITPPTDPQVIIVGFGVHTPSGTPTLDSSYTLGAYQNGGGFGNVFGVATGYRIQSAGAATNPQWTWGNTALTPSCVIAAFGGAPPTPTVATPTFSPAGGFYNSSQSVTISSTTAGATIYYTLDGATPTTSSSIYSGPVTIASSRALQAIAVRSGYNNSAVASASYTITSIVPTPTFSPTSGSFTGSRSVTISDAAPGATIYYTTNGTAPTVSSNIYTGPITVSSSQVLKTLAVKAGFINSAVAGASYSITTPGPSVSTACYQGSGSTLSLGPIDTTGAKAIAIALTTLNSITSVTDNKGNGNAIGLTAAGNNPFNQIFYWETPSVGTGHTVTVQGNSEPWIAACVYVLSGVTGTYSGAQNGHAEGFGASSCQAGSITPGSGPQVIIAGFGVHRPTAAPTIDSSYNLGAYKPSTPDSVYGEAAAYLIQSSSAVTNPQWSWPNDATTPSCVIAAFGGNLPTAAVPTFSPAGGVYSSAQSVTLSDTTSGATIYYTTNGTTPTTSSSVYSSPITVSTTETINAIAVATGYSNSDVAAATYGIPATGGYPIGDSFDSFSYLITGCCGESWANTTAPGQGYVALTEFAGKVFPVDPGHQGLASFSRVAFTNDQYSQVKVWLTDPADGGSTGPCVRMDTHGTGVCYRVNSGFIYALNNGASDHVVASGCPIASNGDVMRLEAVGTSYTCTDISTGNSVTGTDSGNFIGSPGILVDQRSSGGSSLAQFQADCSPSCSTSTLPLIMPVNPTIRHGAVEQVVLSLPVACPSSCGGGLVYLDGVAVYASELTNGGSITLTLDSGQTAAVHTVKWISFGGPLGQAESLPRTFTVDTAEALTATPILSVSPSSITVGQDVIVTENPGYTDTLGSGSGYIDGNYIPNSGFTYGFFYWVPSISRDLGSNLSIGTHTFTTKYSGTSSYAPSNPSVPFLVTGPTATPTFSLAPGIYNSTQYVTITDASPSPNIYYTTNGDTPTTSSTPYTGQITISATQTLKAVAVSTINGYQTSSVQSSAYTITGQAPTPSFSPVGGTYSSSQTVSIISAVPSHTIYYTTNGLTPTTSSAVYTGPITVAATETLQAIVTSSDPGITPSQLGSATYTIAIAIATTVPTITPAGGNYTTAQSVTITDTNPQAIIYYTTDGAVPTTSSAIYISTITVSTSQRVRAIAAAGGETPSAEGSATFTYPSSVLYSYCIADTVDCDSSTVKGYAKNGNITEYNDSLNGHWTNIGYDSLNRLTSGIANSSQFFCWSYDSFGNRTAQSIGTQAFSQGSGECSDRASGTLVENLWAHYNASNQVKQTLASSISPAATCPANSNRVGDYCYDFAGNLVADSTNLYLLDAEGRVCAISNSGTMTQYIYDAEGNRVAKGTISTWTCDSTSPGYTFTPTYTYIVGPNGEQMTELDVTNNKWAHVNIYAGGQLAATYSNENGTSITTPLKAPLYFELADWVGSKRAQIAADGIVKGSWSNQPFGDNQQCITCISDATEQHFTGKERDTESKLDYSGARYYGSVLGRFVSPDPSGLTYADPSNPQMLNLYAYTINNPLRYIDPSGLALEQKCEQGQERAYVSGSGDEAIYNVDAGVHCFLQDDGKDPKFTQTLEQQSVAQYSPPQRKYAPSSKLVRVARCASMLANSISPASLLPSDAPKFFQNLLSNDASSLSDLLTGPDRKSAILSIAQGKGLNLAYQAVGAIPVGADKIILGENGAGTIYAKDIIAGKVANTAVGKAAGKLLGAASAVKLIYDISSYAGSAYACRTE